MKILSTGNPKPVGLDLSIEMISIAKREVNGNFVLGDAEELPFKNNSFNSVSMSFCLRNLLNVDKSVKEIFRVIKPGGKAVFLEMTRPFFPLVRFFYRPYLFYIMPFIASIIGSKREYYFYLGKSIWNFSNSFHFINIMRKNGFRNICCYPLTFGLAYIFVGEKSRGKCNE